MRIACFERDNVTHMSDSDDNDEAYSASFELFPFYEGASYSYFKGLMNGEGRFRGRLCVVRAMLDTVAEQKDWSDMTRRVDEAQRLANEFNRHLGYVAIKFQIPVLAKMDTVSDFACLFRCVKPHDKRLKPGEYVTIEPFIKGTFQRFDPPIGCAAVSTISKSNNRNCLNLEGRIDSNCEYDVISTDNVTRLHSTCVAQAFSHFTWHVTRKLVVYGLQGVSNGRTYTLTNPSIHSTDSQFGYSDGSTLSLAEFFSYHRCNNICCMWETCGTTGKSQRHVNFFHTSGISSDGNK